jgi:hypothetical protein
MPLAATNVAVTVFLKGDLEASLRWYYLEGDKLLVSYPARFEAKTQCASSFEQEDYEISETSFNSVVAGGQFDLQMRPFRGFIDPAACTDSSGNTDPTGNQAYIQLTYMYCLPPSF